MAMPCGFYSRVPAGHVPFAFYGTLMGDGARALPEGMGRYIGPCLIRGRLWDLGAFPALTPSAPDDDLVRGQLWLPWAKRARVARQALDDIEGYYPGDRSLFVRRLVLLAHPRLLAWVYFWGNSKPPLSARAIPFGDWREARCA